MSPVVEWFYVMHDLNVYKIGNILMLDIFAPPTSNCSNLS